MSTRRGVLAGIAAGALAGAGAIAAPSAAHANGRGQGADPKCTPGACSGVHVTPDMFGAVPDGATDCTDAFNQALASGYTLYVPAGDYLIAGALDEVKDRHLIILGDGPGASRIIFSAASAAGLRVTQHTTPVTIDTALYYRTQLSDVGFYTTRQENGIAVDIAYSQKVVEFARNEMLVSVDNVHIAGVNPRTTGWSGGIRIMDVNHPRIENCHIVGRQDSSQPARAYAQFFIMDFGVYVGVTGDIELNYLRVVGTRIKNVIRGIQCVGAGEGIVVIDCAIPVADYGIHLNKEVASGATDPQVMISSTHINAASRCIYIKRMHEIQITGNLLYSFPHVDTGSWAAFEADTVIQATVTGNIIEGFPGNREDRIVGILGTDLRQSTVSGNRYIKMDVPVELTTDRSVDNVIVDEFRSPPAAVGPMVVYSGTASESANYSGPKLAMNAQQVVVTGEPTDVVSVSQTLAAGIVYQLSAVLHGVKGAEAGTVAASLVKTSGTAEIEFRSVATVVNTVGPLAESTVSIITHVTATKPGPAGLTLQASSAGSDLSVDSGSASLALAM
ncbi:glycosyl hydrolase family 28-related protein [Microbacterium immunditiarum]|uniref:Rhamnogalacturonase A/B/Epimerase-like pectate lyase domain-containing protein n=1 Tax=Microbacterium immunditiarum TaxID=337480 RepID=A0A7Y9KJF2_9MICO|nr:glycosyl hydrolase family 28-related protein [Microbacterium immunditiarum]NYE21592.1 hypothetical protein [Microbacterium immunditiarum]